MLKERPGICQLVGNVSMFISDDSVLCQFHVIFLSLGENILNAGIDCHSVLLFCDVLKAAVIRTLFSFSFRL